MPRVIFSNTSGRTIELVVTFLDSSGTELKAPIQFKIVNNSSRTISLAGRGISKAPENTAKLRVIIKRGGNKPDETINLVFETSLVMIRTDATVIRKVVAPEKKAVKFNNVLGPPAVEVEVIYLDKNDKSLGMVKFDLNPGIRKVISNLGKAKSKAPKLRL
jgi:hypothetical protein